MIKQRRRDTQRTIDRLQPGKSKGNLISTITKPPGGTKPHHDDLPGSAKINKEPITKTENPHRPKPMLSLGSVLSTDVINLDVNSKKHTFSDNDSIPSDDEDPFSDGENGATGMEHNEPQAENLALDKAYSESAYLEEKKAAEEKQGMEAKEHNTSSNTSGGEIKTQGSTGSASGTTAEKNDKPKPNLGAWFKAFGAPKAQQTPKRKPESSTFNDNPATPLANEELKDDYTSGTKAAAKTNDDDRYDINEPPPPTPGRFFLYEEDRERNIPAPLLSPDLKPMRRQRKLSTGSSISERSSFSQDPNDPMNSPHPSLDESSYQSPQPYHHQSPIHNAAALKVGFYQDTFPKCGSDKSNSCSPREPMNSCSPQHPMFSPRDSITSPRDSIASPRDTIHSPKMSESVHSPGVIQMTSPRNPIPSPRYTPAASPRDPYGTEPIHSPVYVPKLDNNPPPVTISSPYKPLRNVVTPQPASNAPSEKSPFSIYPVKKRISAELEQTSKQQAEQEKMPQSESPFVPVSSSHEGDRHFTPTPGCLPQHIIPPHNPYPPPPDPSTIPMSIPHHHPFMDTYSDNILLSSNPYFRKDLYVPGQPPIVSSASSQPSHISSLFMQQSEMYPGPPPPGDKMPQNQPSRYSPPRQPSPMVAPTGYSRPIDFTSVPTSSPIPLTKPNESFTPQYHHSKFHVVSEADVALNYSNKNPIPAHHAPQHAYPPAMNYPPTSESDRAKMEADYQRAKMEAPMQSYHHPGVDMHESQKYNRSGPAGVAVSSENVYHSPAPQHAYRSGPSPYPNPPSADYFNGKPPSNYHIPDLRPSYPTFANPNERQMHEEKQYYQTGPAGTGQAVPKNHHMDQAYMADRSMTELMNSRQPHFNPLPNISTSGPKLTPSGNMAPPTSNNRYDLSYHNRPEPIPVAAPPPAAKAPAKKSKKKKAAVMEQPNEQPQPQNPSMYYLGGSQPNHGAPQDLKHNGIVPGSAFDFGAAAAATTLKNDYQQYFDNLRSSRYFAETAAAAAANEKPPAAAVSNASFPFLPPQRGSPSFSLAAQAFMNANAPPCPPAIYSSPFLQRPPDELLRPMMLQQGLMSAHNGGYPHGYLNMHDPINRSPWL